MITMIMMIIKHLEYHKDHHGHLHVEDWYDVLILEVFVDCWRGFLQQTKEDVAVKLDRLHARATKYSGS